MNKGTRKQIAGIRQNLLQISTKAESLHNEMEEVKNQIEEIRESEQEKYDNMPEGIQNSERGQTLLEAITELETAFDTLESIELNSFHDDFEQADSSLETASA